MFGYIAPDLARLKEEQRRHYRSFYCGLCQSLKSRFGQAARVSLSNDMAFLAMLLSSLYEPDASETVSRCAVHPLRPHSLVSSSMIDYAADMNVLLFYLKCRDRRLDEEGPAGKAGEKVFRKMASVVRSRWTQQAARAEDALNRLWEGEKASDPDPDLLCNLSGEMLGACFVPEPSDIWAPQLYAVGEGLGRFVYWMDAWEDYDADIRAGRFNPLRSWHSREDYEDFCRESMEMLIAEATEHFELLPLEKDLGILRNILYSGVWQRYVLCMKKQSGKEGNRPDE